jgi:hypothetical protein
MRLVVGLTLAVFVTVPALDAAPGRVDASKRAVQVSTEDQAVLPENKPIEQNEVVSEKRFRTQVKPKEQAIVGERRSSVTTENSREKERFVTPEQKHYDVIDRKDSPWAGKQSRFSTSEDAYRSKVATRFQDKIGDAQSFNGDMKPVITKRTTFDRVNRFAFRRNGDRPVTATSAGSDQMPSDISFSSNPAVSVKTEEGGTGAGR